MPFDPRAYGPRAGQLLERAKCNELGPGTPDMDKRPALATLEPASLVAPHALFDSQMGLSCLAGLWLRHDFLDESHRISQDIGSTCGSYWHAIMHRREPDFDNAKYWFRRVHAQPIFDGLAREAKGLSSEAASGSEAAYLSDADKWDPFRFVDLCEAASAAHPALRTLCMKIQQREWELLFDYCYQHARGSKET